VGLMGYTLLPGNLTERFGAIPVVGCAMLIGGILLCFGIRFWEYEVALDPILVLFLCLIVLVGTVGAYTLYLQGVSDIGPVKGSMIAAIEPVSAVFFTTVWLHSPFMWIDGVGVLCILSTVFLLAKKEKQA